MNLNKQQGTVMKKIHILKESIIATLIVLLITYVISFFPWSLEYGKALHQGFADFDIYDLYYSGRNTQNTERDTNIVLVQLGDSREEIAEQINLIGAHHSKVIAIDGFFVSAGDSAGDSKFFTAINKKPNLIFSNVYTSQGLIPNFFYNNTDRCGYGNFLGEEFSVIRFFYPRLTVDGKQYEAFTSCIVRMADKNKYDILNGRYNDREIIHYKAI